MGVRSWENDEMALWGFCFSSSRQAATSNWCSSSLLLTAIDTKLWNILHVNGKAQQFAGAETRVPQSHDQPDDQIEKKVSS